MAENSTSWSESDDRALRIAVTDLHRLLRCMEQHEAPADLSWQSIEGRANMAQDLWHKVQEGWHAAIYEDESLREKDEKRFVELEQKVDRACRRAREIAAERRGNEVDIIQEIFFPEKTEACIVNEEKKDDAVDEQDVSPDEEEDEPEEHRDIAENRTPTVPMSTAQEVEELQKAQREQLEQEIAHMAARLKESTLGMNTTLRAQTEELGEMEDLATKNVEKVSNVADNVTDHNKKSWRSTLATWTIIFAVLGSFLFCMMTIRMVPKQRNKCLFFCGTTRQKEVCNRMEDGSVVCVDAKGNPYVKKPAAVSRKEAEEANRAQECEAGDSGECIVPPTTESHDEQDVSEHEAETTSDDVCSDEGECKAQYDDEPDVSDVDVDAERIAGIPQQAREEQEQEHQQALEQVVGAGKSENASSSEEADAEAGIYEPNEDLPHQDQVTGEEDGVNHEQVEEEGTDTADEQVEEEDTADEVEQQSGREQEERVIEEESDAVESKPVEEPAIQNEDRGLQREARQEHQPTVVSSQEEDRETSFRPAEISTLHERFDEDGNRIMDDRNDFTAADAHLAAHWGQNEVLKRYLHLMPEYATARDDNGWQLIHEAANAGRAETIEMLLDDYKVDINARVGLINDGASPLFLAYKKGYDDSSEVVSYIKSRGGELIAPGENPPYKPVSEHTPEELEQYNLNDLQSAAQRGDEIRVAQYIVARRDLLDEADDNGWRPIHEAVRAGHMTTTQLLINAGTDINARTGPKNDGWSPLGLIIQRFDEEHPVARLLRRHDAEIHLPDD